MQRVSAAPWVLQGAPHRAESSHPGPLHNSTPAVAPVQTDAASSSAAVPVIDEEQKRVELAAQEAHHHALFGPFAAKVAELRETGVEARKKLMAEARMGATAVRLRGPRRALQQQVSTDVVIVTVLILLIDFFLGFYTGYLKGFFT